MKLNEIHSDNRGSIFSLTDNPLTLPEISILHTKEGLMRGGCEHVGTEHLIVFEGVIRYFYQLESKDYVQDVLMKAGQSITIPPRTPHYMLSITDSIIGEFGCTVEDKQKKHDEFRKIVLEHNERVNKNDN